MAHAPDARGLRTHRTLLLAWLAALPGAGCDGGGRAQPVAPLVRLVEHVTRDEHPDPDRAAWVSIKRRDGLAPGSAWTLAIGWEPELLVAISGDDLEKRHLAVDCLAREPGRDPENDEGPTPLLTLDEGFVATPDGWRVELRPPAGTGALRVRHAGTGEGARVRVIEIAGRDAQARVRSASDALAQVEGRHPAWHPDAVVRHDAARDLRAALRVVQEGVVECSFIAPPERCRLEFGYLMPDRQARGGAELAVDCLDARGVPFKPTYLYPVEADPDPSWARATIGLNQQAGRLVTVRFTVRATPPPRTFGTTWAVPRHALVLVGGPIAIGGPPSARPDLLLLSIDGLRTDRLAAYGAAAGTTPRLDAFFAGGQVVEGARAPWGETRLAHVALLGGRDPAARDADASDELSAPGGPPRLFEALAASGYRTVGLADGASLPPRQGHARGFDTYVSYDPIRPGTPRRDDIDQRVPPLLEDGESEAAPLALFVHTSLAHAYEPLERELRAHVDPAGVERWGTGARARDGLGALARGEGGEDLARHVRSLYDAGVRGADRRAGELLDMLAAQDRLERALVVLVAGHGEALGERGAWGHAATRGDEVVHVPWLMRGPGVRESTSDATPRALCDAAATIAARLDVPWHATSP